MAPKDVKKPINPQQSQLKKSVKIVSTARPEVKFLNDLAADASSKEFQKMLRLLQSAVRKKDEEVLRHGAQAIERLCAPGEDSCALLGLLKNEGVEIAAYVAVEGPTKDSRSEADLALSAIYRRTCEFLDHIDAVDFNEVPNVMYLGAALAAIDEEVGVATLAAIERLCVHRLENCHTMLAGGAMHIFHLLLSAHRSPELCHETLVVLFRLTDIPGDAWAQHLVDEKDLVQSIVETLTEAPLNIRLQIAGLRLLCLWNQPDAVDPDMDFADMEDLVILKDKVRLILKEAGVTALLTKVLDDLDRAGLQHQAAWLACLAGATLVEAELAPRLPLLRPGFNFD